MIQTQECSRAVCVCARCRRKQDGVLQRSRRKGRVNARLLSSAQPRRVVRSEGCRIDKTQGQSRTAAELGSVGGQERSGGGMIEGRLEGREGSGPRPHLVLEVNLHVLAEATGVVVTDGLCVTERLHDGRGVQEQRGRRVITLGASDLKNTKFSMSPSLMKEGTWGAGRGGAGGKGGAQSCPMSVSVGVTRHGRSQLCRGQVAESARSALATDCTDCKSGMARGNRWAVFTSARKLRQILVASVLPAPLSPLMTMDWADLSLRIWRYVLLTTYTIRSSERP